MSHLQLINGIPNFLKSTISLWFRVPQSTLDTVAANVRRVAAEAQAGGVDYVYPRMFNVIPLMTLGPVFDGYKVLDDFGPYKKHTRTNVAYSAVLGGYETLSTETQLFYTGSVPKKTSTRHANPTFIGLEVRSNENGTTMNLVVRVQMDDYGDGKNIFKNGTLTFSDYVVVVTGIEAPDLDTAWSFTPFPGYCLTDPAYPGGELVISVAYEKDDSTLKLKQFGPEAFEGAHPANVTADHWHHVAVAFDLSNKMTGEGRNVVFDFTDCPAPRSRFTVSDEDVQAIRTPCKMYIALDDFSPETPIDREAFRYPINTPAGRNDIVTHNVPQGTGTNASQIHEKTWDVTGCIRIDLDDNPGLPSFTYTPKAIPSDGTPLGIPAAKNAVDYIKHVEMAEFQMWTGVALDLNKEENRRVFITDEGKPEKKFKLVEDKLGKPLIRLHGSSNWKKGVNTGTLGVGPNGEKIKSGQFTPFNKINTYTPNPSLNGPQGDAS